MFETVILYILNKYDATIYRLGKHIDELFFAFLKSSTGTINPALKRLSDIGCVEHFERMSEGGMLSKTYSITKEGKRYLSHLLITFESKNPYHVVNESKIALFCSDVLNDSEKKEFNNNLRNVLELHKLKLERGINDEYINLNELQKKTVELEIKEINGILELL